MNHYDLETVIANANACIDKDYPEKPYIERQAVVFGWLMKSYENLYNDMDKIANNAFDAGLKYGMCSGIYYNPYPDKETYVNDILNKFNEAEV